MELNSLNKALNSLEGLDLLKVAEGSGHFSKPDRRNFFVISRSSIFECVATLDMMNDVDQISHEE